MNLSFLFEPVEESFLDKHAEPLTIGSVVSTTVEQFSSYDLALFTVCETKQAEAIREVFYTLKKTNNNWNIVDLGTLAPIEDQQEQVDRVTEIMRLCLEAKVIPIVIGTDNLLAYAQYAAYTILGRGISYTNIDAFFDLLTTDQLTNQSYLYKILTHTEANLKSYAHLAYQSYLVPQEYIDAFEKFSFEKYRLGELRKDITYVEPTLRASDLVSLDLSAITRLQATASKDSVVFGLDADEACQLAWYAGNGDQVSSFGVYGFEEIDNNTSEIIATAIWYFIEGFYHRKDHLDFESQDYIKYAVLVSDVEIIFYKSTFTSKWWMKISDSSVLPCAYEDYEQASGGEIPDRWILFQQRD